MFVLLFESKEVKNAHGYIVTKLGDRFWIVQGEWGVTSSMAVDLLRDELLPKDLLLFDTIDEANKFAKWWDPHPWDMQPNMFFVVPVEPVYSKKPIGYKLTI